jgi:hypothetical protein
MAREFFCHGVAGPGVTALGCLHPSRLPQPLESRVFLINKPYSSTPGLTKRVLPHPCPSRHAPPLAPRCGCATTLGIPWLVQRLLCVLRLVRSRAAELQPSGDEKTRTFPTDLKLAQFLIEHGVPINAREYETGRTVLMSIMLTWDTDSMLPILRLLLDYSADPGIADSVLMGQTPISSACGELMLRPELVIRNQFDNPILSTLLDAKARTIDAVNGCAVGVHQPLMVAVMHSSLAAVRLLLQAGAKPDGKALAFVTDQVRGVDELSLGGSSLSAKNHLSVAAASKLLMEQFQVLTEEQQAKAMLLGRCVIIEGLLTKPELNGRHGNPIFYTPKSKRYYCTRCFSTALAPSCSLSSRAICSRCPRVTTVTSCATHHPSERP